MVRKDHNIFVLVWQQIGRRQHGPPLTAMYRVRESNHDVEHRDESVILVGGRPYRGFRDCYLLQSHRGFIVPIQAMAHCVADPNVGQRFYGNSVTVVNVVQIDVGTLSYICKPISTCTKLNL